MATVNPYLNIIKQIDQKSQLDEQNANSQAAKGLQDAYVAREVAKLGLTDALNAQGIAGGGTESAALGITTGYQRQQNAVGANRSNEVAGIRQNAMANRTSTQSQSAQWENDQQVMEENRFANTVTGYDTISKVDNAIDAAKDAGQTWKVGYLMAQRAALVEQAKADAEEAAVRASSGYTSYSAPKVVAPVQPVTQTKAKLTDTGTGYSGGGYAGGSGGGW